MKFGEDFCPLIIKK
ncbi:hypothetical protein RDI58_010547 [Solanum bulbocastanum]|uniref:Uncharacterized protein n=1 Tax=Solanum bulbocastanum TaxID=147425 RepID=A0AAN8TWK4_SOLBU